MKLIVGLGNPGSDYERTLHNAGFRCLDALAEAIQAPRFVGKFKAEVCQGWFEKHSYLLLKSKEYMNHSGKAVAAAVRFFKIPLDDLITVYDDLDLPPGVIRYRQNGGAGGHKGVIDMKRCLGSADFHRLRIGIGRPPEKQQVAAYVLGRGDAETQTKVNAATETGWRYLADFIRGETIAIEPETAEQ